MTDKTRIDVHQRVTDALIHQIEASSGDWQLPWARPGIAFRLPKNVSGRAYNGINIVSLWCSAIDRGYPYHLWGTYRQWGERKAQVRKGEKASLVVFFKDFDVEVENADTGETDHEKRMFAKASWAFNVSQVDGYDIPGSEPRPDLTECIEAVDRFVANTGARIHHGHDMACYRPAFDAIYMPDRSAFTGTPTSTPTESYYATLGHELTHWTSTDKRCDRQLGKRFGDDQYAVEELIAELGSAFLSAELGLTPTPRADHGHYLAHWLKVLRSDKRAIFTAAAAASKAVAYLNGLQPKADSAEAA